MKSIWFRTRFQEEEYEYICNEYCFRLYCVSAVKGYYKENRFFATLKDTYIVFVSHCNHTLYFHSFNRHLEREGLRSTEVTKPPHCMKKGSLKHSLCWIKGKVENSPEKPYYQEMRIRRRKRKKMLKMARE